MEYLLKKLVFTSIFALLMLVAVSGQTSAFVDVNVIPMDKERVLTDQTVIVRDGMIVEIGDAKKVKAPKNAVKIDGKGKFLIPGLVDMHAHLLSDEELPDSLAGDELKIMLANGITTIRLMIGTPEHLILREKSARGEIIAPTIYAASPQFSGRSFGDIFNGYVVTNQQQARESVRRAKQDGYDFIKLTFFITREVYDAVIDEAAKQNIRVIGHVDRQVGLMRALEAKQQIEHLDSYFEAMIPEGSDVKGSTSGVYVWQSKSWESLDILDEKKIPELAEKTVKANPFSCPTLTFLKTAFGIEPTDEMVKSRPGYRFYPPKIRDELDEPRHIFWKNPPSAERRAKYVDYRNKLTKAIYEAGGKIMAGSDSPDWLLLYGFTLHAEMKNLTAAGLPNYAALAAATRNPAEFFGTLDKTGTIEKGKKADLVLLDANPLENISNTEKRSGVMLKGKYFAQIELNKWLDDIAARFQKAFDGDRATGNAFDDTTQKRAVEAIEKLGGKVEYDNKTVVKVDLNKTQITDADLKNLEAFPELRWLDLRITPITDKGVAHLKRLKKLTFLNLFRTNLSDKGLASIKNLSGLETLLIGGTKISDAGLKNLKNLTKLNRLSLFRTQVSDAGLKYLEKLTLLESLLIGESKITDAGAKSLQKVLPKLSFTEQT